MSEPVTLVVQPRGKPIKRLPADTSIALSDSTAELYKRIAAASATSVHRLRIAKGSDGSVVPNSTRTLVQETGLRQKSTITVKDLGPQIAWRTVFFVEYLGPLLIHPLVYFLRPYLYPYPSLTPSALPAPTSLQKLSLAMVTIHFFKRELETLFVHRFSSATMPAFNIIKNSGHYWVLSGLNLAVFAYGSSKAEIDSNPLAVYAAIALFVVGELGNLNAHLVLRGLRPANNPTARGIPEGLGFSWVTCPNYLFEVISWVGVWIVNSLISKTGFLSSALFVAVAGVQMALWAAKKERRYRKEFGAGYKRKKFVMIPGVF
ncbi:putative steroid alpha reductase family protein [Neofusicoccum parvum]|uniref:Steroid alpha reductase family protein n=2 Tax=Neofusicoccum parvum TaxID=310453 RepID=A0ACB5SKL1_9PEZI|nr:putative steroid alpha reductase family protein [Neofusicoccum parvum UCRNP2]GME46166.1 putative steroid alpha reductase family protein [Neofusicoccum parvum]GME50607.1 putative steroid alpha reductase family protein [Neofusicoccum parvum]